MKLKESYAVMTVKELIEELSKLPQGKEVSICGSDEFYIYEFDDYILIDHTELDGDDGDESEGDE